jgi:hypothetical protein
VNHADRHRLLHGPYRPPPVRRGDRAVCLFRDGEVVVTGWSDARISWPRCWLIGTQGGGSGLLVDEELARAVRTESALAVRYWWGVSWAAVSNWRRALGVEKLNEGSALLRGVMNRELGDRQRGKKLPPDQVERRRRTALELGLRPRPGHVNGRRWTKRDKALLGTMWDGELAARVGRTPEAVRIMRTRLGIATARDGRLRGAGGSPASRRSASAGRLSAAPALDFLGQ